MALKPFNEQEVATILINAGCRCGVTDVAKLIVLMAKQEYAPKPVLETPADYLKRITDQPPGPPPLSDRERLLIATLNPTVLGPELVEVIQRATGVEPAQPKARKPFLPCQPGRIPPPSYTRSRSLK